MKKKLDTIHIYGFNILIIFTLFILLVTDKKSIFIPSISALTINLNQNNNNYQKLSNNIEKNKNYLETSTLKVDQSKLDDKIVGISAIIYDPTENKAVWSQDSSKVSSLASLTKVMSAYVYKKHCDKDIYFSNLTWKSDDAIKYMLIESSNEMADALSRTCMTTYDFVEIMNKEAQNLNLNLSYKNPSGLDSPGVIGGRGDALSLAQFIYIASNAFPSIFDATTHNSKIISAERLGKEININAINTNKNIGSIGGARMSKTGLTDYAGGNLAVMYDISLGRPIILLVLGSTKDGRFQDIELMRENINISY